jgi:SAM-dependent MidA family methyltransferase
VAHNALVQKSPKHYAHTITISLLNRLPKDFSGVVIANEVLDAMPAKRLINQTDGFKELGVDCQDDKLVKQHSSQVAHNALVHKSPKHYTHTITISLFIIEILTKKHKLWLMSLINCALILPH